MSTEEVSTPNEISKKIPKEFEKQALRKISKLLEKELSITGLYLKDLPTDHFTIEKIKKGVQFRADDYLPRSGFFYIIEGNLLKRKVEDLVIDNKEAGKLEERTTPGVVRGVKDLVSSRKLHSSRKNNLFLDEAFKGFEKSKPLVVRSERKRERSVKRKKFFVKRKKNGLSGRITRASSNLQCSMESLAKLKRSINPESLSTMFKKVNSSSIENFKSLKSLTSVRNALRNQPKDCSYHEGEFIEIDGKKRSKKMRYLVQKTTEILIFDFRDFLSTTQSVRSRVVQEEFLKTLKLSHLKGSKEIRNLDIRHFCMDAFKLDAPLTQRNIYKNDLRGYLFVGGEVEITSVLDLRQVLRDDRFFEGDRRLIPIEDTLRKTIRDSTEEHRKSINVGIFSGPLLLNDAVLQEYDDNKVNLVYKTTEESHFFSFNIKEFLRILKKRDRFSLSRFLNKREFISRLFYNNAKEYLFEIAQTMNIFKSQQRKRKREASFKRLKLEPIVKTREFKIKKWKMLQRQKSKAQILGELYAKSERRINMEGVDKQKEDSPERKVDGIRQFLRGNVF